MDHKKFITSLMYDLDTIQSLEDYGRLKETVWVVKKILMDIQSCEFRHIFSDESWSQKVSSSLTLEETLQQLNRISTPSGVASNQDLQNMDYVSFLHRMKSWLVAGLGQMKESNKSPQKKMAEKILIVLVFVFLGVFLCGTLMISKNSKNWGLRGEFYTGKNFEKRTGEGVAKTINFKNSMEMIKKVDGNNFSVRWSGFLLAPSEGVYNLSVFSDDGIRLYLDEQVVFNEWRDLDNMNLSKDVYLTKGLHPIRIDYYNNLFSCILKLYWTPPGGQKKIIPSKYLRQRK